MKTEKYPYALSWPGSRRGTGVRIFNTFAFLFFVCVLVGINTSFVLHWVQQGLDGVLDLVATALVDALMLYVIYNSLGCAKATWLRWEATEGGILLKYPLGKPALLPWDKVTRGYVKEVRVLRENMPVILLHKTYTLPRYFSSARNLESFCNRSWIVLAYTPQTEAALKGHVPLSNVPAKTLY